MTENATNTHRPDKVRILLITNRDSDNVGDQVIEACDVALIKTAIRNMGLSEEGLTISSRALGMIPARYFKTKDRNLLKRAYDEISACDLVLFGGAPVFNYKYQLFYKHTLTILSIAKEFGKPVLFSAIGIDSYDESARCQELKAELHNGAVKQITTRDGIDRLRKYASMPSDSDNDSPSFPISLVADPAVLAKEVFSSSNDTSPHLQNANQNKRIGIFVFRAGGFSDNGIRFTRQQQCVLWSSLCNQLETQGFDYELLTSGHFADEAFLQYMIDNGFVSKSKCACHINTPEDLVQRINSYAGIISCRLHPSIIAFSCKVPSISLIWNSIVTDFYSIIGYPQRTIAVSELIKDDDVTASPLVAALSKAMDEGVERDRQYIESIYQSLCAGIASCLDVPQTFNMWVGDELIEKLSSYPGTSLSYERQKIGRKLTRCYRNYNDAQMELTRLRSKIKETYKIIFHSGDRSAELDSTVFNSNDGWVEKLSSGNTQYHLQRSLRNEGNEVLPSCGFLQKDKQFNGWRIRFRIDKTWYWLLDQGAFVPKDQKTTAQSATAFKKVFGAGSKIPYIPVNHIDVMVAEATWEARGVKLMLNSGKTSGRCTANFKTNGSLKTLQSGSVEFSTTLAVTNGRYHRLPSNGFSYPGLSFSGWKFRVKVNGTWLWYLKDGSLVSTANKVEQNQFKLIPNKGSLPNPLPDNVEAIALEAVWKKRSRLHLISRL